MTYVHERPELVVEEKRPCPNCGANDWTFRVGVREGEHGQFVRYTHCNRCADDWRPTGKCPETCG